MSNSYENPTVAVPVEPREGDFFQDAESPAKPEAPEVTRVKEIQKRLREHDINEVREREDNKNNFHRKDNRGYITADQIVADPNKLSDLDLLHYYVDKAKLDQLIEKGFSPRKIAESILPDFKIMVSKGDIETVANRLLEFPLSIRQAIHDLDIDLVMRVAKQVQERSKRIPEHNSELQIQYIATAIGLPLNKKDWENIGLDAQHALRVKNSFVTKINSEIEAGGYSDRFSFVFRDRTGLTNLFRSSEKGFFKRPELLEMMRTGLKGFVKANRPEVYQSIANNFFECKRLGLISQEELDSILKI